MQLSSLLAPLTLLFLSASAQDCNKNDPGVQFLSKQGAAAQAFCSKFIIVPTSFQVTKTIQLTLPVVTIPVEKTTVVGTTTQTITIPVFGKRSQITGAPELPPALHEKRQQGCDLGGLGDALSSACSCFVNPTIKQTVLTNPPTTTKFTTATFTLKKTLTITTLKTTTIKAPFAKRSDA